MNTLYVVALWGPVIAIFFMGVALMLYEGPVSMAVAISTPTVLAGVEALAVVSIARDGDELSKMSELLPLLETQVFLLSIVALILIARWFVAYLYKKKSPESGDGFPFTFF